MTITKLDIGEIKRGEIKIVKSVANLSIYLTVLILLASPILSDKILYSFILLVGAISFIGFILLIKVKENNSIGIHEI